MSNLSLIITDKEPIKDSLYKTTEPKKLLKEEFIDDKLWVDKYRPKKLSEIILKKELLDKITNWIEDFIKKKPGYKNSLLLYGAPGTGKTTIANIIFKSYNFDPIEFNASDIRNQKLIHDKINEILGKKNILDMMMNKSRKIGIIMDEIDGMSSGDRGGMSELIKLMYKNKKRGKKEKEVFTPFICISNTVSEKKFNDLKKNSVSIKVAEPSIMYQIKLVKRISKEEGINMDEYSINMLIKQSQGDFRRLINMLQYIFLHKDKTDILYNEDGEDNEEDFIETDNMLSKALDTLDEKNKSFTTYECVDKLLNNYNSIENTIRLYDIDKNIIGMLFYENFLSYIIKNRKNSNKEKIDNIHKIYENYSQADILDNNIYIKQCWDLYDYNCVLKCSEGSYLINNMKKYSCNKMTNLSFSNLLNKTSLEYLNYKNTNIISNKLSVIDTTNMFIDIARVVCDYVLKYDSTIDKGLSIMKYYNLTFEDFEKLIKITFNDYKNVYSSKKKKKIKNSLK